jgi:hypothetical protein
MRRPVVIVVLVAFVAGWLFVSLSREDQQVRSAQGAGNAGNQGGAAGGSPLAGVDPPRQEPTAPEPTTREVANHVSESTTGGHADVPPGGAGDEVGAEDPLGTGAKPGDLSATQKGRAKMTISNLVIYCYGFSGRGDEDLDHYVSAIARVVKPERFYDSPGAQSVRRYGETVRTGGTQSTAVLAEFRVEKENLDEVVGTAVFTVQAKKGPLKSGRYEQRVVLGSWGNVYRVESASELQRSGE